MKPQPRSAWCNFTRPREGGARALVWRNRRRAAGAGGGFTLVELLVVMAIIALVMMFAVPAMKSLGQASNVTHTGEAIDSQIKLARQTALSSNRIVEVRFYKLKEDAGSAMAYRAMQLISYDEPKQDANGNYIYVDAGSGTVALPSNAASPLMKFPGGIVVSDNPSYSNLINTTTNRPLKSCMLPGYDAAVEYQYFRFLPSGSSDLNPAGTNGDQWCLSVLAEQSAPRPDRPADNFVTVMVDPVSGQTQTFRP